MAEDFALFRRRALALAVRKLLSALRRCFCPLASSSVATASMFSGPSSLNSATAAATSTRAYLAPATTRRSRLVEADDRGDGARKVGRRCRRRRTPLAVVVGHPSRRSARGPQQRQRRYDKYRRERARGARAPHFFAKARFCPCKGKKFLTNMSKISEWLFEENMNYGAVPSVGVGEAWEWGKGRLR